MSEGPRHAAGDRREGEGSGGSGHEGGGAGDLERRALDLFLEIAELEGDERSARLEDLRGGDERIHARVLQLLAADSAGTDLGGAVDGASRDLFADGRDGGSGGSGDGARALPAVPGYDVLEEIGRGGAGVVFRARHRELDREVALKMLRDERLAGPDEIARFRRESVLLARLQHPNIVQVFEVGRSDPGEDGAATARPWLAMELVEGPTLAERIAGRPWDPDDAARLVETLCRAVAAAHDRGVIHRDLKPGNVLIDARAEPVVPKIADFGIARPSEDAALETRTGALLGTPSYMAPEQAAGRPEQVGPRTDVHALGAILYELLTGVPPFESDSTWTTIQRVMREDPIAPRRLRGSVPHDLETIALKALAKDPDHRYGSAAALGDDLRRYLAREPIAARRPGPVRRLSLWVRRQPALAATLAAALLVVAVVTVVAFRGVVAERDAARTALHRALVADARARIEAGEGDWLEASLSLLREAASVETAERDARELRQLVALAASRAGPQLVEVARVPAHAREPIAVAVDPSRDLVATSGARGDVALWRLPALHPVARARLDRSVRGLAFAADGRLVVASGAGEIALLRAGDDGLEVEGSLSPDGSEITALDGVSGAPAVVGLASGAVVELLRGASPAGGSELTTRTLVSLDTPVEIVAVSPSGGRVAVAGDDGRVVMLDRSVPEDEASVSAARSERRVTILHDARNRVAPEVLRFDGNDSDLVYAQAASRKTGFIWPLGSGFGSERQDAHESTVLAITRLPDRRLLTLTEGGVLRLWSEGMEHVALERSFGDVAPVAGAHVPGHGVLVLDERGALALHAISEPDFLRPLPEFAGVVFLPGTQKALLALGMWQDLALPSGAPGATAAHELWPSPVSALAEADGDEIAVGRVDGSVEVRTPGAESPRLTSSAHGAAVKAIAASEDGSLLASATRGGDVAIARLGDGETIARFEGSDPLEALAWRRGLLLVAGGGVLRSHDAEGRLVGERAIGSAPVLIDVPGDRVFSVRRGTDVEVLALGSGRTRVLSGLHGKPLSALALGEHGRLLASGDVLGTLVLRDASSGEERGRVTPGYVVDWLGLSRDGELAFTITTPAAPLAWPLASFGRLGVQLSSQVDAIGLVRDDADDLLLANQQGAVRRCPLAALRAPELASYHGYLSRPCLEAAVPGSPLGPARGIVRDPTGRLAATTGDDGRAVLWDLVEPGHAGSLGPHAGPTRGAAFSPDGARLAVGTVDGEGAGLVVVWDVHSRERVRELRGFDAAVTALAVLPDETIVGGDAQGLLLAFEPEIPGAEAPPFELARLRGRVNGLRVADGHLVAAASGDALQAWRLDGDAVASPEAPAWTWEVPGRASALGVDAEGAVLAVATDRRVIHLVRGRDRELLLTLPGAPAETDGLAFSDDGTWLAASSYEDAGVAWNVARLREELEAVGAGW